MKRIFIILSIVTLFFSCTFEDPKEDTDTTKSICIEDYFYYNDLTKDTINNKFSCTIGPDGTIKKTFTIEKGDVVNVYLCFPEEIAYLNPLPFRKYTINYPANTYNDFSYRVKESTNDKETTFNNVEIIISPQSIKVNPFNNNNQKIYYRINIFKSENFYDL